MKIYYIFFLFSKRPKNVDMSEWLRRQTRNLLGFACAGSNPAVDAFFYSLVFHFCTKPPQILVISVTMPPKDCPSLRLSESLTPSSQIKLLSLSLTIALNLAKKKTPFLLLKPFFVTGIFLTLSDLPISQPWRPIPLTLSVGCTKPSTRR